MSKTASCECNPCECDPCECKPCECDDTGSSTSSSSSSSSSSDKERIEETVQEVLEDIIEEQGQKEKPCSQRRLPTRYLYYGALALPWAIVILDRLNVGACPWLNSTFSWS